MRPVQLSKFKNGSESWEKPKCLEWFWYKLDSSKKKNLENNRKSYKKTKKDKKRKIGKQNNQRSKFPHIQNLEG